MARCTPRGRTLRLTSTVPDEVRRACPFGGSSDHPHHPPRSRAHRCSSAAPPSHALTSPPSDTSPTRVRNHPARPEDRISSRSPSPPPCSSVDKVDCFPSQSRPALMSARESLESSPPAGPKDPTSAGQASRVRPCPCTRTPGSAEFARGEGGGQGSSAGSWTWLVGLRTGLRASTDLRASSPALAEGAPISRGGEVATTFRDAGVDVSKSARRSRRPS